MATPRNSLSERASALAIPFSSATLQKTNQNIGKGKFGSFDVFNYIGSYEGLESHFRDLLNQDSNEIGIKLFHEDKVDLNEAEKAALFYLSAKEKGFKVPYGFGLPLINQNGTLCGIAYKIIRYPLFNAPFQMPETAEAKSTHPKREPIQYTSANAASYIWSFVADTKFKRVGCLPTVDREQRFKIKLQDFLKGMSVLPSANGRELFTLLPNIFNSARKSIAAVNDLNVVHRDIAARNLVISLVRYVTKRMAAQYEHEEGVLNAETSLVDYGHASELMPFSGAASDYSSLVDVAPIRTLSAYTIKTHKYHKQDDMIAFKVLIVEIMALALNTNVDNILTVDLEKAKDLNEYRDGCTLTQLAQLKMQHTYTDQIMLEDYLNNLWDCADLYKDERRIIIPLLIVCMKEFLLTMPDREDPWIAQQNENQLFTQAMENIAHAVIELNKSEIFVRAQEKEKLALQSSTMVGSASKSNDKKKTLSDYSSELLSSDLENCFVDVNRLKSFDLSPEKSKELGEITAPAILYKHFFGKKADLKFYNTSFHRKIKSSNDNVAAANAEVEVAKQKRSSLFNSAILPNVYQSAETFASLPPLQDDNKVNAELGVDLKTVATVAAAPNFTPSYSSTPATVVATYRHLNGDTPYSAVPAAPSNSDTPYSAVPTSGEPGKEGDNQEQRHHSGGAGDKQQDDVDMRDDDYGDFSSQNIRQAGKCAGYSPSLFPPHNPSNRCIPLSEAISVPNEPRGNEDDVGAENKGKQRRRASSSGVVSFLSHVGHTIKHLGDRKNDPSVLKRG